MVGLLFFTKGEIMASPYIKTTFSFIYVIIPPRLRQVLFAKRVPVKQEVKPPVAVWLEQTVR